MIVTRTAAPDKRAMPFEVHDAIGSIPTISWHRDVELSIRDAMEASHVHLVVRLVRDRPLKQLGVGWEAGLWQR